MTDFSNYNHLRQLIEKKGFITVAEFMETTVIGNKISYYDNANPFGEKGDFITSPEISQLFGEMIGLWVASAWNDMGRPKDFLVVELGPGRGLLMDDLLRATYKIPNFIESLNVCFIERSKNLIKQQKKQIAKYNKDTKFYWYEYFSELPNKPAIIIANEFFDSLPINQYIKINKEWHEKTITIMPENKELCFSSMPVSSLTQDFLNEEHPNAGNRSIVEISNASIKCIQQISSFLKENGGMALIIDYGYDIDSKIRTAYNSTLQAIKNHKFHPVLENVGEADISSHVDFFLLKKVAAARGCKVYGSISQKDLLRNSGIEIRAQMLQQKANLEQKKYIKSSVDRLISDKQMGLLFKAIAVVNDAIIKKPFCF